MRNKQLFLLNREGRVTLLAAFTPTEFVTALKNEKIQGLYGTYPDIKDINQVKSELNILGEEGGRINLGEKTFYIRFFLSLLVFLAIFYLLVYLVPDPIPLVDELVIGLTGAVLFSFWHRKRMERGDSMVRMRIEIKGYIDKVEFKESPLLREVEFYLEALDVKSIEIIAESWSEEILPFHSEDSRGLLPELTMGIEKKLGRNYLKRFKTMMDKRALKDVSSTINIPPTMLSTDLSLAVLYWKLMATLI